MEPKATEREQLIPVYSISYNRRVCCHACGRQNWPATDKRIPDGRRRFDIEHAMFAVSKDLTMPKPGTAMVLCSDCLKEKIAGKLKSKDYALYVKGECEDNLINNRRIVLNFKNEEELTAWLIRKVQRDSEVYSVSSEADIMIPIIELHMSHTLKVKGVEYGAQCYRILCRHFGFTTLGESNANMQPPLE